MDTPPPHADLPFFVYGTLLPEQPNAHLWADYVAATHPAVLTGARLHDMGHYPMLVEVDNPVTVQGVLLHLSVDHLQRVTLLLDRLERYDPTRPAAGLYRRRARTVQQADGDSVAAWVYIGRPEVALARPLVPNGNWAAYTHRRRQELASWWHDHGAEYDRSLWPNTQA